MLEDDSRALLDGLILNDSREGETEYHSGVRQTVEGMRLLNRRVDR